MGAEKGLPSAQAPCPQGAYGREEMAGAGGRPRGRRRAFRQQGSQSPLLRPVGCHHSVLLPEPVPVLPAPTGPRAGDYTYREGLEHKCKRDILLGRLRSSEDQTWKRIRPRPTKTSFVGSYYLCKGGWAAAGAGGTAQAQLLTPGRSSASHHGQAGRQTGVVHEGGIPISDRAAPALTSSTDRWECLDVTLKLGLHQQNALPGARLRWFTES